ncbi:MAG: GNAT family N-acetyltransferase [Gammaproteobacteria bacterium]
MTTTLQIRAADWDRDRDALKQLRHEVFVVGQNVPEDLEWDGEDAGCRHALAILEGAVVGTGRLTPQGKIGRMAVLDTARGLGIGGGLLRHLMAVAQTLGLSSVHLHAQTHALAFYARHGFKSHGDEFDEAGIPHLHMVCELAAIGENDNA